MPGGAHRIQRLTFDVQFRGTSAQRAVTDMLQSQFDAVIAPAFETALDAFDASGAAIRIDQLEVNLGALGDGVPAPEDFRRRLTDAISAALQTHAAASLVAVTREGDAEELSRFLEDGSLPWADAGNALEALLHRCVALDAKGIADLAMRLRTVLVRRRAVERLVHQCPAVLVVRLYRALLSPAHEAVIARVFGPDVAARDGSVAPFPSHAMANAVAAVLEAATTMQVVEPGEVIARFASLVALPKTPASANAGSAMLRRHAIQLPQAEGEGRRWPVHAAGGVLLYPFVARWFDAVGLLASPGRFKDDEARARGVLLLHHAATGTADAPEPDTLLSKLLCGHPFGEPVPRSMVLTEAERAEEASVLESLVRHWSRLGNTTPQGVRDGFLLRPGQLVSEGGRLRLVVERRGVDVLLNYLPWALSIVKTPFMAAPLTVDWR